MDLSYRAVPDEDGDCWRWELLCGAAVVLEGVATTHAGAVAEVAQVMINLRAARLH